MGRRLTKAEAIEYLGLDDKTFDNYFRNAEEFCCLNRINGRGRFYFDEDELKEWLESYRWRMVELTLEDYALCLDFALAQHFRGYVLSDWGGARQREFGQKVSNWMRGQLAEVAVQKFFKRELNFEVILDFDLHEEIVPQDIVGVVDKGNKRLPKINVAVKGSKPKNAYLVLSENEILLPNRKSDVYIFGRPDLPDDHLLRIGHKEIVRLVGTKPLYSTYMNDIAPLGTIPCEIAGYSWIDELEEVDSIPGQDFMGIRYVKQTGKLHRSKQDWKTLAEKL